MKKRIFCVVLVLIVALCVVMFFTRTSDVTEPVIGVTSSGNISIPGYEGLTLEADTKKQNVALNNPEQNNCYFVIELLLEDGTLLWTSDYIKPGKTSSKITLNQTLPKGNYPNTTLKYSCFTFDKERTPLNGAEIKLTLWVK